VRRRNINIRTRRDFEYQQQTAFASNIPSYFEFAGQQGKELNLMSEEQENKAIVGRWFKEFWGNSWNPNVVDELSTPDILLQYSLHAPRRGRKDVKKFMTEFREAFPDLKFWGTADLIAEGDKVVGRWEGGGTHTGPAFSDFRLLRLRARKCDSREQPCFVSKMARLLKKSVWTTV